MVVKASWAPLVAGAFILALHAANRMRAQGLFQAGLVAQCNLPALETSALGHDFVNMNQAASVQRPVLHLASPLVHLVHMRVHLKSSLGRSLASPLH